MILALAIPAAQPSGAEVLALQGPLPAGLADRIQARVAAGPGDVPGGGLAYAPHLPDAGVLAALPADALLVIGDCTAEVDGAPLAVAVPPDCDPGFLAGGLVAADAARSDQRADTLRDAGFHVVGPARPAGDGGLVISAMPPEALSAQSSPLIVASLEPAPFQPLSDAAPRPGLPEPSVVLGDMAVLVTAGARGPLGLPHPAREAIRQRDAAMFDRLLGAGAFDPEAGQVAAAIQTELARMNCYGGSIDGAWGGGSTAALGRYVGAGGRAQAGSGPDIGLFRAIAGGGDVTCAPVQTAAPAAASPASGGTARRSPPRGTAAQPARNPAAAPARQQPAQPPAAQGRQINRGLMGTGVFR